MSPRLKCTIRAAKAKFEDAKAALDVHDHVFKKVADSPVGEKLLLTITGFAMGVGLGNESRSELDEMARLVAIAVGVEPQVFATFVEFQLSVFELIRVTGAHPIAGRHV
jgi:hypothetical protein